MTDRIKELTTLLKQTIKDIDWMGQKVHPKLNKKATAEELGEVAEKLGRDIPPMYETFLKIGNGIDGADILQWTINGTSDVKNGESFRGFQQEVAAALKSYDPEDPTIDMLLNAHIIASDFHNELVIFDPSVKTGEPKLLRIAMDANHQTPFEDFEALLSHVCAFYEDQLAMFDSTGMDFGGAGGDAGGAFDDMGGFDATSELKELEALLSGSFGGEPEPEPELQVSPEMALAARLCTHVIDRLVGADLVELVDAPGARENLEDYMLRKLMKSRREDQVLDNWIHALGKAREVEELYGTDDELKKIMQKAWDEIADEQETAG